MTSDYDKRPEARPFGSTAVAGDRDLSPSSPSNDRDAAKDVIGREAASARAEIGSAAETVKEGAANLAATARDTAREKATEGLEKGKSQLSSSLGDFAAAVRKASDELGGRDQSMAAGLVRQVANGLEQATGSIEGASLQDITRSVTTFARRQPTTFLIGAALAGIALGRFARASGEHASSSEGPSHGGSPLRDAASRWTGEERSQGGGYSAATAGSNVPSRPVAPPVSSGPAAPRSAGFSDSPVSYANPSAYTPGGSPAAGTPAGGSGLSRGASVTSSPGGGPAPAEGPSGAVLGHGSGSGSMTTEGGRDVR